MRDRSALRRSGVASRTCGRYRSELFGQVLNAGDELRDVTDGITLGDCLGLDAQLLMRLVEIGLELNCRLRVLRLPRQAIDATCDIPGRTRAWRAKEIVACQLTKKRRADPDPSEPPG